MKLFLLLIFCFFSLILHSQEYSTNSKKAIDLYEEAGMHMQIKDYRKVIKLADAAIDVDVKFIEAWLIRADAYDMLDEYDKVEESCKKAVQYGGEIYPIAYFFLANAQFRLGKYQDALDNEVIFIRMNKYTALQKEKAMMVIESCKFAIQAMAHPVQFEPKELGPAINTKYDEYWPSLSVDDQTLLFNRQLPINPNNPEKFRNRQEDIYFSELQENGWGLAKPMDENVNSPDNEGTPFITRDGMQLYFTGCNRPGGKGQCDIYVCDKTATGWSPAKNLDAPVNTSLSEKQASLSSDGRTLYFSSNRGNKGNFDIWKSVKDESGKWSVPENIGDSINTPEIEQSPYIHPDDQTMYFASNGRIGMGGFDIYMSRRNASGNWGKALNLGYPINSFADEIGLVVDSKAQTAYFSSNRIPENGRDIYSFVIPQEFKPQPVSYIKGKIFDAETLKPLKAFFELIDINTGKTMTSANSNPYNGSFLLCLPINHEFALNVSRKDYLFYSDHFQLDTEYDISKPFQKDIALQPIKPGKNVVLKNIFYETNSYQLQKESEVELNKLVGFMNTNPDVKIEIGGHTDNVGKGNDNLVLSENRAKVVVEFLISKGINKERLLYKGYGETMPIADNSKSEGRALNRRTEFKILP